MPPPPPPLLAVIINNSVRDKGADNTPMWQCDDFEEFSFFQVKGRRDEWKNGGFEGRESLSNKRERQPPLLFLAQTKITRINVKGEGEWVTFLSK